MASVTFGTEKKKDLIRSGKCASPSSRTLLHVIYRAARVVSTGSLLKMYSFWLHPRCNQILHWNKIIRWFVCMLHFEKHMSLMLNSSESWSWNTETASWLCLIGQVMHTNSWANWILFPSSSLEWARGRGQKRRKKTEQKCGRDSQSLFAERKANESDI